MENDGLDENLSGKSADISCDETSENFQRFIYNLFEKNGILNDLRAYLRGHIVNVLKSANSGQPSPCHKNFTQRLELNYQAFNILIAEYLLKLDLSYSLSIFVSEIPLANMVFDFAKQLHKSGDTFDFKLRLQDKDIWAILNYIGIKCDSDHTNKLINMYKCKDVSLLECIFKCVPMFHNELPDLDNVNTYEENNLSSDKSTDSPAEKRRRSRRKCKHPGSCKSCHSRILHLKEKCKKRKEHFVQSDSPSVASVDVGSLMKNVNVIEKGIINEMFEQLKSVYEAEVEMMREEHQNSFQTTVNNHALQLQRQRDELEKSYKEREAELHRSVEDKKRFLWSLAKSLKQQHEHVAKAMQEVRDETQRLISKEENINTRMQETEELLLRRGDEMRQQISQELQTLESNLRSLRQERDSINAERVQLENIKSNNNYTTNVRELDDGNKIKDYDLLKDELRKLKMYFELNVGPKCEKGVDTSELNSASVVNNLVVSDGARDRVVAPARVNNDLKIQKNVNFNLSQHEMYRELTKRLSTSQYAVDDREHGRGLDRDRGQRCDRGGCGHDACQIRRLQDENERLKVLARQQSDQLSSLHNHQVMNNRPRTAPNFATCDIDRLSSCRSGGNFVNPCGGGEQLDGFAATRPRVVLPNDTLPFIGVRGKRVDTRKVGSQWHSMRAINIAKPTAPTRGRRQADDTHDESESTGQDIQFEDVNVGRVPARHGEQNKKRSVEEGNKSREKSPKSMLKEAKENLRNKSSIKDRPALNREQSPNNALREAKMRLRKLEIEAEAVHNSYQEFRRRQEQMRLQNDVGAEGVSKLGAKRSTSLTKLDDSGRVDELQNNIKEDHDVIKRDFDKYLREYKTKFDIAKFKNKNTISELINPIPKTFTELDKGEVNRQIHVNYLETPLAEFRKLYHVDRSKGKPYTRKPPNDIHDAYETLEQVCDKEAELNILKDNLSKIYQISPQENLPLVETSTPRDNLDGNKENNEDGIEHSQNKDDCIEDIRDNNILRVDIENVCATAVVPADNVLVLVESSVDTKDKSEGENDDKKISTQMTIFVSPKEKSESDKECKADVQKLTDRDVLDAIFHAPRPGAELSSVDMQLELSKVDSISVDKVGEDEYPDDFSADVDNYNSRSEYEQNSPISFAKCSEDNLWD